jgi:PIN domain nuclease of toxin-antitoxin system
MRLLLDRNVVIRLTQAGQFDRAAQRIIERSTAIYVSAVSIWEIAIKSSVGKLDLDMSRLEAGVLAAGAEPLPVTWAHARRSYDIAVAHPDPFDRLLLAQAVSEPLHLLTSDERLAQYSRELVITV